MYNIANTTLPGECYQGEIRLADTTDVGGVSQEGRVEVCVNNAWGTVCDRQFGAVDAAVFCDQVTGFQRSGKLHVLCHSTPFEMPILMVSFFAEVRFFRFWPKTMDYI